MPNLSEEQGVWMLSVREMNGRLSPLFWKKFLGSHQEEQQQHPSPGAKEYLLAESSLAKSLLSLSLGSSSHTGTEGFFGWVNW